MWLNGFSILGPVQLHSPQCMLDHLLILREEKTWPAPAWESAPILRVMLGLLCSQKKKRLSESCVVNLKPPCRPSQSQCQIPGQIQDSRLDPSLWNSILLSHLCDFKENMLLLFFSSILMRFLLGCSLPHVLELRQATLSTPPLTPSHSTELAASIRWEDGAEECCARKYLSLFRMTMVVNAPWWTSGQHSWKRGLSALWLERMVWRPSSMSCVSLCSGKEFGFGEQNELVWWGWYGRQRARTRVQTSLWEKCGNVRELGSRARLLFLVLGRDPGWII